MDMTRDALSVCASKFNFSEEEAWCLVNESIFSVGDRGRKRSVDKGSKSNRSNTPVKKSIPLPYSGECNDSNCQALRQNNGLYTQCQILRDNDSEYCSSCEKQLVDGKPVYGTIMQRKAAGLLDYVAPNGKKPVSYMTILKKLKFTKEEAEEEAGKQNITIDPIHFEVVDRKRGRRKVEKEAKEPKSKGRPKKQKKVIEIAGGEESDDLFASLVANLSISDAENKSETNDNSSEIESVSESEDDANKEAKKAEKEAKKAEKEAKKAEAETKKAEKEAKKAEAETKKAEKEAKKAEAETKKAEKEAKKAEADKKKAEKEAKKAEKETKKAEKEEEPETLMTQTYNGKKYYKSTKTGIIYDRDRMKANSDDVVVLGNWNETTQKIDFTNDEESEEEYESDDE